jgi:hypothetical protein
MRTEQPERRSAGDVVERFIRGARPRLWINNQEVGPVTNYRDLADGQVELCADRVWRSYSQHDVLEVTWG